MDKFWMFVCGAVAMVFIIYVVVKTDGEVYAKVETPAPSITAIQPLKVIHSRGWNAAEITPRCIDGRLFLVALTEHFAGVSIVQVFNPAAQSHLPPQPVECTE